MEIFRYSLLEPQAYVQVLRTPNHERWKEHTDEWNLAWLSLNFDLFSEQLPQDLLDNIVEIVREDADRYGGLLRRLMWLPASEAILKLEHMLQNDKRMKTYTLYKILGDKWESMVVGGEGNCRPHPLELDDDPLCVNYIPEEIDQAVETADELLARASRADK